mgnify:CR=1 FL=1
MGGNKYLNPILLLSRFNNNVQVYYLRIIVDMELKYILISFYNIKQVISLALFNDLPTFAIVWDKPAASIDFFAFDIAFGDYLRVVSSYIKNIKLILTFW